jgi:hypothetical protein
MALSPTMCDVIWSRKFNMADITPKIDVAVHSQQKSSSGSFSNHTYCRFAANIFVLEHQPSSQDAALCGIRSGDIKNIRIAVESRRCLVANQSCSNFRFQTAITVF